MKLDGTFAREIEKTANGDGSRKARFAFLNPARDAAKRLSTPNVRNDFDDVLWEYGRATVGLCVAVTVYYSLGIYGGAPILWEQETEKEIDPATRERIRRAILENSEIPFFRQGSEAYRKNSAWAKVWIDGAGREQEIPIEMIQEEIKGRFL